MEPTPSPGDPTNPTSDTPRVNEDGALVDSNGEPITDEDGTPVYVNEDGVVVDSNGEPVVDDEGNPVAVPDPETPVDAPVMVPAVELADCSTPGPRQVRRLTAEQYAQTLQSIFGDSGVPQEAVLSNASVHGFNVDAQASVVRDLEGELLMNYAERVADWAVDNGKLGQFTSCMDQNEGCQRDFIGKLGERAHREPLDEERIVAHLALFEQAGNFEDGARAVISAMLQSPYLLYRREMGAEQGGQFALTPFEVASQLSYWLTDAPPDDQLYQAAKNGQLSSTDDLLRETDRLLQSDAARATLGRFVAGWLHLDKLRSKAKDESIMPLPAELRQSMVQETEEFFVHSFYEGASLADLFTARHSYLDQRLASLYGLGGGGDEFQRTDLTGSNRPSGLLGQAAFLTTHALSDNSSPVQRAKVVIERLLCASLPPVPANLNVALDVQTEFSSNRERYEVHREREECRVCHENMDPIGFAFEHYDGFGRYRDQENGVAIDATGSLNLVAAGPVALDGVDSLSAALAESPEVQQCLVRYLSYYAFGSEGWANQECNQDGIVRYALDRDFTLDSVLHGIVQAPHFAKRVQDQ